MNVQLKYSTPWSLDRALCSSQASLNFYYHPRLEQGMSIKTVHLIAIDKKKMLLDFPPHFNILTVVFFMCPVFPGPVVYKITLAHRYIFHCPTGTGLGCLLFPEVGGVGWWELGEKGLLMLPSESDAIRGWGVTSVLEASGKRSTTDNICTTLVLPVARWKHIVTQTKQTDY